LKLCTVARRVPLDVSSQYASEFSSTCAAVDGGVLVFGVLAVELGLARLGAGGEGSAVEGDAGEGEAALVRLRDDGAILRGGSCAGEKG